MDRVALMEAFTRVAATGSFSAAAQEMRVSKAAMSKYVTALEDRLGVRLLNRTTRRLSLTEVGQAYYEHCSRILAEIEEADLLASRHQSEPRGRLRLSAPVSFGVLHVTPAIAAFLKGRAGLQIDLLLSDRPVDLIEEGFDLALWVGPLADSSLIVRRLATARAILTASPDYLARCGTPSVPDDLRHHNCLRFANVFDLDEWPMQGPDGPVRARVGGTLRVNNAEAMRVAAVEGLGIAPLPDYAVAGDLAAGRLQRVLPAYNTEELGVHAIYPHNRHLPAKVRAFIDFLAMRFRDTPDWGI